MTTNLLPALPERDTSKTGEQQGLFNKFEVKRTDGSDQPGGKHHGCENFVLDVTHDPHAKVALAAYAASVQATHPLIAADMRVRYGLPAAAPVEPVKSTPGACWRAEGETDPHGERYDCERAALVMGHLSDDELANAAFMNYDVRPSVEGLIAGTAFTPMTYMTAVKDRIRWLSRALESEIQSSTKTLL